MFKIGIGLLAASSVLVLGLFQEQRVPGDALAATSLDKVLALGCGQYASTQGQAACKYTSPGCKPTLVIVQGPIGLVTLGLKCLNNGTLLGCTGASNLTCAGVIDPLAPNMCIMYNAACCTPTQACLTSMFPGNVPGGFTYTCGVTPSTTGPVGQRQFVSMIPCPTAGPVTAVVGGPL